MKFISAAEEKRKNGIYVLLFLMLSVGVGAGSVYLVRGWNEMGGGISEYLSGFFASVREGTRGFSVMGHGLASNLVTVGIIFIMGFFRFGCLGTGALIIRRGFVIGFTSASFFKAYGMRGILIMLSTMPVSVITAAVTLAFSAISISFSMQENKFQKKFIFSYIFFTILVVSIFCAATFAEGFVTTTFMKLISPEIN